MGLEKDEATSHATCELLLLDIRTGIIPFSEVRTRDFFSKKEERDINEEELKKRVMKNALLQSVEEASGELRAYLKAN